ncbi:MAG TPA: hypothetical protein VML96_05855, partial [Egibacteraceae bacterium]|nr:hypothetical protein [Egibacteraceae bacterium]
MNRNDDFDNTLEAWLHRQAPAQAPNRVLDAALERAATESQRRSWLQRFFGGTAMTLMIRTAEVAAVVAVSGGAASLAGRVLHGLPGGLLARLLARLLLARSAVPGDRLARLVDVAG